MAEDYYKVLGLDRNATPDQIQGAYRELARKYHPDLNPDDRAAKENFQKVQQAYEVLNDPSKREMYDRYGSSFESVAGGPGGAGAWQTHGGPSGFEEFDFSQVFGDRGAGGEGRPGGAAGGGFADIFRQFSEGAGRRQRPRRGADLRDEVTISFATSIVGGEVRLAVQRGDSKTEMIDVKIPPGIRDGKKIRLRGQGERLGGKSEPGDILITVRVGSHPCFQRRGNDLDVKVPVTVEEAALGAKVDVPTPRGTITLTIPPGTSSGRKLRIKGQGVAAPEGKAGDLYADIQIVLPESLDEESKSLIRKLGQRQRQNPRADLKW